MHPPRLEDGGPSLVEQLLQEEHRQRSLFYKLPESDLADLLVDAYFDKINSQISLLHRPTLDRAVARGLLDHDASFRQLCE